jgi:hypothetical protein
MYFVALVRTDVSENIPPPSSGFPKVPGFHNIDVPSNACNCRNISKYLRT